MNGFQGVQSSNLLAAQRGEHGGRGGQGFAVGGYYWKGNDGQSRPADAAQRENAEVQPVADVAEGFEGMTKRSRITCESCGSGSHSDHAGQVDADFGS